MVIIACAKIIPQNLAPVQLYLAMGSIVNYNEETWESGGKRVIIDT